MDKPIQSRESPAVDSEVQSASVRGGYSSQGVPGEEGDVRKHMRVLKVGDRSQRINKSRPLSGRVGAEQGSAARLEKGLNEAKWAAGAKLAAQRPAAENAEATSVFVIAKKGLDFLDTPVFHAGDSGDEEAVAVFTNRESAQEYLDYAVWGESDEIGELSPKDAFEWLVQSAENGIQFVTINPDRQQHIAGHPQPVLALDDMNDKTPDTLYQELTDLARK